MAVYNSSITNEIIITAMDRFVWFVILVVMSHLVTEFTRVTGYARGNRNELKLTNDTLLQPKSVHNMVLYPGEQQYGLYEPAQPLYYYQSANQANSYAGIGSIQQQQQQQQLQSNAQIVAASSNTQPGFTFSFRPLIDSIFEIPLSTLRAVNNLVARLTGSYQSNNAPHPPQKSATTMLDTERSNNGISGVDSTSNALRGKRSLLREEIE